MYKILKKEKINSLVKLMDIEAPLIARKSEPGQFVILRINEEGERIPLTITDYDREKGTITVVFQEVGKTTKLLGKLNVGDSILDFVGPLGNASHLSKHKRVLAIGGGVGIAPIYPQIKKLHELGIYVDVILGGRNEEFIIFEDEIKKVSDHVYVMTDDGSIGEKGLVTHKAKELIEKNNYDHCIAIGPVIMMKFVCMLTKEYKLDTTVSMNPIMIDGTGMCGGCRVRIGKDIKFACVDGPEFDGHLVDFDGAMRRQKMYVNEEKESENHECRLGGK